MLLVLKFYIISVVITNKISALHTQKEIRSISLQKKRAIKHKKKAVKREKRGQKRGDKTYRKQLAKWRQ